MTISFNKSKISKNLITKVTSKKILSFNSLNIGDFITVTYKIFDGAKEKVQIYSGLVIAIQNSLNSKSFTLKKTLYGVGVEYIFPYYSPNIIQLKKIDQIKVCRSKLFFLRSKKKNKFKGKFI